MANIFSSVRLNCVESHKQHSNTLYYVACLDSVMDIKVKLTLSECHQRSFSIRNGILWKWTGMFEWRLGIDVSKSQRQSKLEQVWDAPLHCIISRFDLKCFTCASEAQQYPESSSSFEMLVFNFESKIETLESWGFSLHTEPLACILKPSWIVCTFERWWVRDFSSTFLFFSFLFLHHLMLKRPFLSLLLSPLLSFRLLLFHLNSFCSDHVISSWSCHMVSSLVFSSRVTSA